MRRLSNPSGSRESLETGASSSETQSLIQNSQSQSIPSSSTTSQRSSIGSNGVNGTGTTSQRRPSSSTVPALPGRPRRKQRTTSGGKSSSSRRKRRFWYRCYAKWVRGTVKSFSSLFVAVLLWYSLGVISIGTSKILLTKHEKYKHLLVGGNVPPLFLTLQQLFIGSTLLRFLLQIRFMGSSGLQPWPSIHGYTSASPRRYSNSSAKSSVWSEFNAKDYHPSLVLSAVYFCMGFLATNYGFSSAPASFVETIKAAEPITSASVAVLWGIESLSRQEVGSLGAIVTGVLLSTLGNNNAAATTTSSSSVGDSLRACLIVMASNLCFSFRGLYQKLFRATPEGNAQVVDDLNLQFRMQQIGVILLIVPVLIFEFPSICRNLWNWSSSQEETDAPTGSLHVLTVRYLLLALLNGCAFTSYNLASTYILSRISVVHHAALNCIRRIFAIMVTSILFSVPISFLGAVGICFSVVGFMAFSHYKVLRQQQPKPISSLLPVSVVKS